MARHVLGVLGVIAAGVLLLVSAAMNYRFGFSLGKTPADGEIYGAASAAADCFKALVPFFFFAAWRNRMWSQAFAAAVVWVVVTGYSMTSALGHAALNRLDTSGQRAVATANYKDLRADSKRAQDQLTWIPAHRPAETVAAELNVLKAQRYWLVTKECTEVAGRSAREYCQQYHKLAAELASGRESQKLESRIADIGTKLAQTTGGTVMAEADPQASVLAKMTGIELEKVQTVLTLFVALLIEIGSGFGMYVAFAYWRMHATDPAEATTPAAPMVRAEAVQTPVWSDETAAVPEPAEDAAQPPIARPFGDNDNPSSMRAPIMPPNDVQRFYQEDVISAPQKSYVTATKLNEAYKAWCKRNDRRTLAMPNFLTEFDDLKVEKHDINGVKFFGIALRPEIERELEKRPASRKRKVSQAQEVGADQSRAA